LDLRIREEENETHLRVGARDDARAGFRVVGARFGDGAPSRSGSAIRSRIADPLAARAFEHTN